MFTLTIFDTFISIGVTDSLVRLAQSSNPEWAQDGMSGYDIEDYVKSVLPAQVQDQIHFDPEHGGFYAYYPLASKETGVSKEDVERAKIWAERATSDVLANHMQLIARQAQEEIDRIKQEVKDIHIDYTEEVKHLA